VRILLVAGFLVVSHGALFVSPFSTEGTPHASAAVRGHAPARLILHRGDFRKAAGLLLLTTLESEPALGLTNNPLSGIASVLGVDGGEFATFSRELYGTSNSPVKVQFSTCWPVRILSDGSISAGYLAANDNRLPGEQATVQIVKKIGATSIEDLKTRDILDATFNNNNDKLGESNNAKQAGKVKTITGSSGEIYKLIGVKFTRVGNNGRDVESHAMMSACVVSGDLITFIAYCRESTWDGSKKRLIAAAESFRTFVT